MTVELREEFEASSFDFYDTYDADQAQQLRLQQHVDIRSFRDAVTNTLTMYELDHLSMTAIDAYTMALLEGNITVISEAWTAGVTGPQADRNHSYGISLTCGAGVTNTQSVMVDNLVDISALATTDVISLALPAFPLASVTQASSFVDFTSHPSGDFSDATQKDSVAFSASTVALIAGNSQLRFPISLLTHIDHTAITGVRFRVAATGACTFRCLAIRALSANWLLAPMDTDTLYHLFTRAVALNGAAVAVYGFPSSNWPIIWRSDDPPGVGDPRPIDLKTTLVFNTGSMLDTGVSDVALYFRELGLDENTQNDMTAVYTQDDLDNYGTELETDGSTVIWTTATLPGRRVQPDFGRSLYRPHTQVDIDTWTQASLNSDTQFMIEHAEDTVSAAYLEAKVTWTNAVATLTVFNADGVGYTFAGLTLTASTNYSLFVDLEDDSMRVGLFTLDGRGMGIGVVYDTTIVDDAFVHRHKGRFGWHANLLDGDAHIEAIRPRSANFSEYVSLPFYSNTPVMGARLIAHSSPDLELITSLTGAGGGLPRLDSSKSNSGHAYKIVNDGTTLQGVETNTFYIDNFGETEITVDLHFPATALAAGVKLIPLLLGENGRIIGLAMTPLMGDHWESVKIALDPYINIYQTGYYQLLLLQNGGVRTEWYLDHLSCHTRVVGWDGRGRPTDAWGMSDSEWLPFLDTVNKSESGLVFSSRGDGMQVRARAIRQSASITDVTVQPKYAELGSFSWPDDDTTINTAAPLVSTPELSFTTAPEGAAYAFTAGSTTYTTTSKYTAINTPITFTAVVIMPAGVTADEYHWDYGDGHTALGSVVVHTYANLATSEPGETTSLQAVLRVTDSNGQRWYARKSIYLT